jgi:hypothetical protein
VGKALALVGYPITVPASEGKLSAKDPLLIPWLAERGFCWVTKDDDARSRHRKELVANAVSVIWVRGIDRVKAKITPKQLHLMLATRLDEASRQIGEAAGPRYFLLYMNGDRPTLKVTADIGVVGSLGQPTSARRRRRERIE